MLALLPAVVLREFNGGEAELDSLNISYLNLVKIETPLEILPGIRLVFLDQVLLVGTFRLASQSSLEL